MEHAHQWYLSKEELACTPSRKSIDANKELSYRQQAANFIQDMGQRLQVSQLCINTAIVYMHRFYVYHSFTELHRNSVSVAALFLAAKVEEQPRKLEHVIKVAHICLHKDAPPLDVRSEAYADKQFEVVALESILLQTLGFTLAIDHPHTYVVKVCQLVKASKDLAQTSYFMATTSLHMTTMCLQYKPTIVACVCIHLACKWSSWKIEPCSEGKEWYFYVDKSVTLELLENLTQEFITILESSPHRFKRKFIPSKDIPRSLIEDSSKHQSSENKHLVIKKDVSSPGPSTSSLSINKSLQAENKPVKVESATKRPAPSAQSPPPKKVHPKVSSSHSISIDAYREKKEKERLEQKPAPPPTEVSVQSVLNKPQHALSEHERVHKHPSNSLESHSHLTKEKVNKSSVSKDSHSVHPASMNKMNHHFAKKPESAHTRESKSNSVKLPSSVSSDPVVVLERVDAKSGGQEVPVQEGLCSVPLPQSVPNKLTNAHSYKYVSPGENIVDSKESFETLPVSNSPVPKVKHHKHKTNSLHSNHNSAQTYTQRSSPTKDIKTNGSKDVDPNERRNAIENSVACVKTPDNLPSKHEKREKHKIKHSSNSSKEKSMSNHIEQSNPSIKVKIRKDIICLSESSQKSQTPPVKRESPKKTLKIKLPKPPVPEAAAVKGTTPASLKLVITKDKSGSGSYCTSHKNDRESRKRVHSPSSQDSKHVGEASSKHPKLDHSHSSHTNVKQSKPRHSSSRNTDHSSNDVSSVKLLNTGKESTGYHNVDVENYTGQPYYGNQYFPSTPPLPPSGYRGKTNFNLSLPTQPQLPPPE